jgi:hypothetical protein
MCSVLTLPATSTAEWAAMFGASVFVCAVGVALKFDRAGCGVVPGAAAVCAVIALYMLVISVL